MNFYTEVKTDVPQHITQTPPPQLQTRLPQKTTIPRILKKKLQFQMSDEIYTK